LEEDESLRVRLRVGGWLDDDDEGTSTPNVGADVDVDFDGIGVVATGVDEAVVLRVMRWLHKQFF